jgi:hypothetical protein
MSTELLLIGYLALHRILVFLVGGLSLILGYKLLMRAFFVGNFDAGPPKSQTVEFSLGVTKISVKNLAPGSLFAFFGAILVSGAAIYHPPEINLQFTEKTGESKYKEADREVLYKSEFRGQNYDTKTTETLKTEARNGGISDGLKREIRENSVKWNELAWQLIKNSENNEVATYLAQAAVASNKLNDSYLHTLAVVFWESGDKDKAIKLLTQAVKIDNRHQLELERWQSTAKIP